MFLFAIMTESLLSPPMCPPSLQGGDRFELLCACATANPSAGQAARIESIAHSVFANSNQRTSNDGIWSEFLSLAEHHGILALVAHNLTNHARGLPPDIEQTLRSSYEANLRSNLWFASELMRVMHHFAQKHLRSLPYKGPVLAQSAYGDLGLRSFADLDLLISPDDFSKAKEALAELGYHPSKEESPAIERWWLRTGYERTFDGTAGKNLLELQWNLLPYFYAVNLGAAGLGFEDLLARSRCIALGAREVPCLSPEDSLLVLCLHAAKHLWTRLIWVADIAESLRAPGIDFQMVAARARDLGILRILGVSFWLAEHLLGASVPAPDSLPRDPQVAELGQKCAARLAGAAGYDLASVDYFRQIFHLRERSTDRWRYLWRLASTPGPGDVATLQLPERMFPLYRVARIGRLLRKLV